MKSSIEEELRELGNKVDGHLGPLRPLDASTFERSGRRRLLFAALATGTLLLIAASAFVLISRLAGDRNTPTGTGPVGALDIRTQGGAPVAIYWEGSISFVEIMLEGRIVYKGPIDQRPERLVPGVYSVRYWVRGCPGSCSQDEGSFKEFDEAIERCVGDVTIKTNRIAFLNVHRTSKGNCRIVQPVAFKPLVPDDAEIASGELEGKPWTLRTLSSGQGWLYCLQLEYELHFSSHCLSSTFRGGIPPNFSVDFLDETPEHTLVILGFVPHRIGHVEVELRRPSQPGTVKAIFVPAILPNPAGVPGDRPFLMITEPPDLARRQVIHLIGDEEDLKWTFSFPPDHEARAARAARAAAKAAARAERAAARAADEEGQ